jgi:tripeptide aminopeptidase
VDAALASAGGDALLALFLRLVGVASPSRHERAVADLVLDEVRRAGLGCREDDAARALGGDTGNLIVRVPGTGAGLPIAIAAHLDTVAVDGAVVPRIDDGIVRSAGDTILGADDKAAVTALVAALSHLATHPPAGDVVGVFTVAEEIGLRGASELDVAGLGCRAGFVFDTSGPVGDVVVRAPSQKLVAAEFIGLAAHAGIAPERGRSAVQAAARAVAGLELGRLDDDTTANIGTIAGGTATNVVPDRCRIEGEVRAHEAQRLSETVAAMIAAIELGAAQTGVDVEVKVSDSFAGYALGEDDLPVRLACAALKRAGVEPRFASSGGGSDVNVFNLKGLASVNLSVGMEDVHSSRESIPVACLHTVRAVMLELIAGAGAAGVEAGTGTPR